MYIYFVDFSKAFDFVKWAKLWETLLAIGTPKNLFHFLQRLHEDGAASVRADDILSSNFHLSSGVSQGCIVLPLLFKIYTELIMSINLKNWPDRISVGGYGISNLRYTNDRILFTASIRYMEELLQK